jgi:predicted SAM-dependent methyltransferase
MKKYLNIGCGSHYSVSSEWTNIDFISNEKAVLAHNLLDGIPFGEQIFDFAYHSHVLEHFSKKDGENFLQECNRVLKPGGILRIAIPDLEKIVRQYINFLDIGLDNPNDGINRANYNWMLLEMYDQTVRNQSGGQMLEYLSSDRIVNEAFIYERIGQEGSELRKSIIENKKSQLLKKTIRVHLSSFYNSTKKLLQIGPKYSNFHLIGKFRLGGEIHQWMYDRYSISFLLKEFGFTDIIITDAFNSYLENWNEFELDGKNGIVRKPDSLFIEAIKK